MTVSKYKTFLDLCRHWREDADDVTFSEVVSSALSVLEYEPLDLSWEIDIPVPIIIRWSKGDTFPGPHVADFVVSHFEDKATGKWLG